MKKRLVNTNRNQSGVNTYNKLLLRICVLDVQYTVLLYACGVKHKVDIIVSELHNI